MKKETSNRDQLEESPEDDLNITDTYKLLMKIFKLPAIMKIVAFLLTCKVLSCIQKQF